MTFFVPEDRYQSPYLSAYTALAFGWLQSMGYQPPVAVWDKLDAYLQTLLREDITVSGYGSAEMRAQVRATALAALAQRGELKAADLQRSEERRVGKECVSTWRSRGAPDLYRKQTIS